MDDKQEFSPVDEDSVVKEQAKRDAEKAQNEKAWSLSQKELESRQRALKVNAAVAENTRNQRLASVGHGLIIVVAIFSTTCFMLAVAAIPLSWIFPKFLPPESIATLTTVATFGFGIIIGNNLDRLFPKQRH